MTDIILLNLVQLNKSCFCCFIIKSCSIGLKAVVVTAFKAVFIVALKAAIVFEHRVIVVII